MRKGRVAGVALAAALVAAACGMEQKERPFFHDDDASTPEFSAARLGDGFDDDSAADFLAPEEREAVRRSGMSGLVLDEPRPAPPPPPQGRTARVLDGIGKVGISLLGVALTIGAAIAPFFLF